MIDLTILQRRYVGNRDFVFNQLPNDTDNYVQWFTWVLNCWCHVDSDQSTIYALNLIPSSLRQWLSSRQSDSVGVNMFGDVWTTFCSRIDKPYISYDAMRMINGKEYEQWGTDYALLFSSFELMSKMVWWSIVNFNHNSEGLFDSQRIMQNNVLTDQQQFGYRYLRSLVQGESRFWRLRRAGATDKYGRDVAYSMNAIHIAYEDVTPAELVQLKFTREFGVLIVDQYVISFDPLDTFINQQGVRYLDTSETYKYCTNKFTSR